MSDKIAWNSYTPDSDTKVFEFCLFAFFVLWLVYFLIATISAANQKYFMGTTAGVDKTRSYQNILTRKVIYFCSLLEMCLH